MSQELLQALLHEIVCLFLILSLFLDDEFLGVLHPLVDSVGDENLVLGLGRPSVASGVCA